MNSERPKRRWFQLHLLTVVLLLIISGALMLTNSIWYDIGEKYAQLDSAVYVPIQSEGRGWPYVIGIRPKHHTIEAHYHPRVDYVLTVHLLYNVGMSIVILLCVGFTVERAIDRKQAK